MQATAAKTAETIKMPLGVECVMLLFITSVPNVIKIGQVVAEISPFFHFLMMVVAGLFGFPNSGNLNSQQRLEGQDASPCHISSKSV